MSETVQWSGLRILVGDLDWDYFKILRELLFQRHVDKVERVTSGARALEELTYSAFDLLILGDDLEDMSAIDLVDRLRDPDKSTAPGLPIILLTGRASEGLLRRAVETGVDHLLVKPTSQRALYGSVEILIRDPPRRFEADGYFGPDRRRMPSTAYMGPKRRSDDLSTPGEGLQAETG